MKSNKSTVFVRVFVQTSNNLQKSSNLVPASVGLKKDKIGRLFSLGPVYERSGCCTEGSEVGTRACWEWLNSDMDNMFGIGNPISNVGDFQYGSLHVYHFQYHSPIECEVEESNTIVPWLCYIYIYI